MSLKIDPAYAMSELFKAYDMMKESLTIDNVTLHIKMLMLIKSTINTLEIQLKIDEVIL
jgi:hypothetical protein